EPKIIEKNGTRFGFLAFTDVGPNWLAATDTTSGIIIAGDPDFDQIIQNAKTKCNCVLIVSMHWGEEYQKHTERQESIGHSIIDDGATMVIGTHPHVAQDIEKYHGGL